MTEKNVSPAKSEPKGEKKSRPKPVPVNWAQRLLLVLIVFLLGTGAAIYFLPALKTHLPVVAKWIGEAPAAKPDLLLAEKISALEKRLALQDIDLQALKVISQNPPETDALLRQRLDRLEQAGQRTDDMSQSARIDMLLSRMSQLEASFIPLSKSLAEAQEMRLERSHLAETAAIQAEKLDNMAGRLDRVEAYAARDNSGALLAFRIGELRRKITSGAAYGVEIDALKAMISRGSFALNSQIATALDWLDRHRNGIVPGSKLRDRFDDLIPALVRAGSSHTDDSWWRRAYNSARSLIMVRKTENTGENPDNIPNNIIAGAQQMLDQLDLSEALALLRQLPDNMRERLDDWIKRAEIYMRAEDELTRLESLAAAYYLDAEEAEEAETPS
ncbi:MAG: hypothetical protein COB49_02905 [Alphaproteobacteria bacterium]|nr:MAG: hypothetical protein COB49_02905 [Alphaproteobacteria bacterium]